MVLPITKGRIGRRTALLSLAVIAIAGFALGKLFTAPTVSTTDNSASLGINVDTHDLQRLVFQSHRGLATNWGRFSNSHRVVFFGYTSCPDLCPMGLFNAAGAVDILEKRDLFLTPIFITVDPKRDTPEVLNEYVAAFHDRMEGLTGKEDSIKTLASAFLAFYEVAEDTKDDEYYLIDHTSYVYLVGDNGEVLGYYPESTNNKDLAEAMLVDFRQHQFQ
jgi:protein SCO1/2